MNQHPHSKSVSPRFAMSAMLSLLIGVQPFIAAANDDLDTELMSVFSDDEPTEESAPSNATPDKIAVPEVADTNTKNKKKLAPPDENPAACPQRPSRPNEMTTLKELVEQLNTEGKITPRSQTAKAEPRSAPVPMPIPRPAIPVPMPIPRPAIPANQTSLMQAAAIAIKQVTPPLRTVYKKAGRIARNGYRRSTFHCAAYVRVALEKAKLIKPGGLHHSGQAKYYGCGLKKNGFVNLCGSRCEGPRATTCKITPAQAPMGSVLIYDNTGCGHPAGHMEIKTPKGYVSDYLSSSARTGNSNRTAGSCRRLVGIWMK